MKLWVDDIRNAPDESWTIARTVTTAIRAIRMFGADITEISLDHDISHQVTVGDLGRPYPCKETFLPVAMYIASVVDSTIDARVSWRPVISIHTSNPQGGKEMATILAEAGIMSKVVPMGLTNRLEMEI